MLLTAKEKVKRYKENFKNNHEKMQRIKSQDWKRKKVTKLNMSKKEIG